MRTAVSLIVVATLYLGSSIAIGQEPTLEPIPLPAPENSSSDDQLEPTMAIRPDDSDQNVIEQATHETESEPELQPIPSDTEPPITLQSPVIESAPVYEHPAPEIVIESAPTTIIEESVAPPIRIESPIIESVQPSISQSQPATSRAAGRCVCEPNQRSLSPSPEVRREFQSYPPTQRREVTSTQVRRPAYPVYQQQSYASPVVRARSLSSPSPSQLRYDQAGPYTVRQSTQIRPGPGRTTTQITTYELTRYRPVTFQVAVPQQQRMMLVPAYAAPVPPVPVGPVRSFLRRF